KAEQDFVSRIIEFEGGAQRLLATILHSAHRPHQADGGSRRGRQFTAGLDPAPRRGKGNAYEVKDERYQAERRCAQNRDGHSRSLRHNLYSSVTPITKGCGAKFSRIT